MTKRISVVVPTRNSAGTIERCLRSIRDQTHPDVELVVVDNSSEDNTAGLVKNWADIVVTAGPERSAQRNVGARLSSGDIIVFIDSDMILDSNLLAEVYQAIADGAESVVLPERIDGTGYWQRVRSLEKELILGDPDIEAARAFPRRIVEEVGGYDESLVAGPEDWEFSDRVRTRGGRVARTNAGIAHVEDDIRLSAAFRKKRYYGTSVRHLLAGQPARSVSRMVRVRFFARLVSAFGRDPAHAVGLFFLKTVEFAGIGAGIIGWRTEGTRTVYGAPNADKSRRVLVAAHELFADGAAQALVRHLDANGHDVTLLALPFADAPEHRIGWGARRLPTPRSGFMPFLLVRDLVAVIIAVLRRRNASLFVGVDPFNCSVGLVLRLLRLWSPTVILYSIDFVPERFSNRVLNSAYHAVDRWCASRADVVWNVSPDIQVGRIERRAREAEHWAPAITVPIGIDDVASDVAPSTPRLVFIGHLTAKQGVRHAVAALQYLPDVRLDIAGVGPAADDLVQLVGELGLEERVRMVGYVETAEEMRRLLREGGIGLAPYEQDPSSFTRWADPTKLKTYLAAGLPVLVTDVPSSVHDLVAEGCAFLIEPSGESIAAAAGWLLADADAYRGASQAALVRARIFTWDEIFPSALDATAKAIATRFRAGGPTRR